MKRKNIVKILFTILLLFSLYGCKSDINVNEENNSTNIIGSIFESDTKTRVLKTGEEFNDLIPKDVAAVIFTYEKAPSNVELIDVDEDGDGGVVAGVDIKSNTLYVSSQDKNKKIIFNPNCSNMFAYRVPNFATSDIARIVFSNVDVSKVTDMSYMFDDTGISVDDFSITGMESGDVSNVIDMSYMFHSTACDASSGSIGDLSNGNVSSVTSMEDMFNEAGQFAKEGTVGDLSDGNTSNVVNMMGMFEEAGEESDIGFLGDLSNGNVSKVERMGGMFSGAGSSASHGSVGSLSSGDVSNVVDMRHMFDYIGYYSDSFELDLSNGDVSHVMDMDSMFYGTGADSPKCSLGDISRGNTSRVFVMDSMFDEICKNDPSFSLDLSGGDVTTVDTHYYFIEDGYTKIIPPIGED